eukprot:437706_1
MSHFFQSVYTNVIIVIYICAVTIVQSQSSKQVVLTPQITDNDGAGVLIQGIASEVDTSSGTTWSITSKRIDTWHLKVNLDNSWGFDPNYESTITLEIDGEPLSINQNPIFAFTAG